MNIWVDRLWTVRLWIWIYFLWTFIIVIGIVVYFLKEWLLGVYYKLRYPEKAVRVVIHYKSHLFKSYWRLIPSENTFNIEKKLYLYDPEVVSREDEFITTKYPDGKPKLLIVDQIFAKKDKGKEWFKIGNTHAYEWDDFFAIKSRFQKYPEIHYMYNCPEPILFDLSTKKLAWSSTALDNFQKNDLMSKLINLKQQTLILILIMVIVMLNAALTMFVLAKQMGWLEGKP